MMQVDGFDSAIRTMASTDDKGFWIGLFNGELVRMEIRDNHVGERTREELNTDKVTLEPVSAYTVSHLAVRYRPPIPRLFIQLTADNAFNQSYDHPGVRTSIGIHAERLPQPGANLFFHLTYELGPLP